MCLIAEENISGNIKNNMGGHKHYTHYTHGIRLKFAKFYIQV